MPIPRCHLLPPEPCPKRLGDLLGGVEAFGGRLGGHPIDDVDQLRRGVWTEGAIGSGFSWRMAIGSSRKPPLETAGARSASSKK